MSDNFRLSLFRAIICVAILIIPALAIGGIGTIGWLIFIDLRHDISETLNGVAAAMLGIAAVLTGFSAALPAGCDQRAKGDFFTAALWGFASSVLLLCVTVFRYAFFMYQQYKGEQSAMLDAIVVFITHAPIVPAYIAAVASMSFTLILASIGLTFLVGAFFGAEES